MTFGGGSSGITKEQLEQFLKEKDKSLEEKVEELKMLMESNQLRMEALLSQAIEREMITEDQFDKLYKLLQDFGRKKGWVK